MRKTFAGETWCVGRVSLPQVWNAAHSQLSCFSYIYFNFFSPFPPHIATVHESMEICWRRKASQHKGKKRAICLSSPLLFCTADICTDVCYWLFGRLRPASLRFLTYTQTGSFWERLFIFELRCSWKLSAHSFPAAYEAVVSGFGFVN